MPISSPQPLAAPPLQTMVIDLRVLPAILGLDEQSLRPMHDALAAQLPIVETIDGVTFDPANAQVPPQPSRAFRMRDEQGSVVLTVGRDHLILEVSREAYAGIDAALVLWRRIYDVWRAKLVSPDVQPGWTRLGMRFVNFVDVEGNPRRHIAPDLLGSIGADGPTKHTIASLQELRTRQGEAEICTIRHGLIEDGARYVLDFDWYLHRDTSEPIDADELEGTLRAFNLGIYELLQWAVTADQFRAFARPDTGDDA